ncbi:glutamate formimidoyltransferase [Cetobacterium somerae]|uniref:glutamate formimidoyltransferase n=1 Tax=Cetobacterium sp. NK01 TaxID=2993530 RepID=UPI0021171F63|nr:glutamate formimidoyltransferase [Cetobacterium sp. NK01]MCQ8212891.1 glutamate formimidoyltransferase [Cetobacterium sp. NK01]
MKKLVQCVPNYSEGKDLEKIEKIAAPFKKNKNIKFMGCEPDADYNRTVITVIGEPEDIIKAVVESVGIATELIDMNTQKGEHLRMGATDVIPFIPIKDITMAECVEISKIVAQKIWEEYRVPIFLYEESATAQNRVSLPSIRKGEYEGMKEKLKIEEWKPDFGERAPHPTAGVTAVGGRMPLIAFNINLDTTNINIAKEISKAIRFSSGGFRFIQAGPAEMKEKGIVQVTMNIKDYKKNPIYRVFEAVKMEARRYGVNVLGSEIIGAVPMEALSDSIEYYLGLDGFKVDKIIENELLK